MSVVGSVTVRVVPSFSGMHRQIAQGFGGARSVAVQEASKVGTSAGSAMAASISGAILGHNFTRSFTSAFGRGVAVATNVGADVGRSFMVSTAGAMGRNGGTVAQAAQRPFSGVMSGVAIAGGATGMAFSNAAASSLGAGAGQVERVAQRPFSGVMSGVAVAGGATGLSFTNAASSRITSSAPHIRAAATAPFSGLMAPIATMGNATGVAFTGAAASSLAAGGTAAGTGFMSRLGVTLGGASGQIGGYLSRTTGWLSGQFAAAGTIAGSGFLGNFTRMLGPLAGVLSLGAILGGGFSRLAEIDDAEAKFRGLGYSAEEIDTQMDSALGAVEGTTIGLNEAATAAVGAAGAGVDMGEDMTGWLTAIGDATAMSNAEYGHMAQIMNRVQGAGRVMGGDLTQMAQNGFEAASILAEHMGIGVDEVQALASAGEISADLFQEAIEGQIGGAAKEMSQTLSGSVKEAAFQIKIMSAEFLDSTGIADGFRDAMLSFAGFLEDTVTPAISDMVDWFEEWSHIIKPIATTLAGVLAGFLAFKGVALIIGGITLAVRGLSAAIWAIPIVGWIAMAIGALTAFFRYTEVGQEIWEKVWDAMTTAASWAWENVIQPVFGWISTGWDYLMQGMSWAWENVLKPAWDALTAAATWMWETVLQPVWGAMVWAWDALSTGISWAWENLIKPAWDALSAAAVWMWEEILQPTWDALVWAWDALSAGIAWAWENLIKPAWDALTAAATWMWENVLQPVWSAISWAWDALSTGISWAWENIIKPAWDALLVFAEWMWENVLQPVWSAIQWAWEKLSNAIQWAWENIIKPAWDALLVFANWMWENVLQPVWNAMQWAWEKLSRAIMWAWENILKSAWDALVSVLTWMWENVVSPIFNWMMDLWSTLANWFMSTWNGVLKPVFDLVIAIITWLWENVAKPYFRNTWEAWVVLGNWLWDTWTDYIWPTIKRFGNRAMDLWNDYINPALGWISDKWGDLKDTMVSLWENHIQPMLQDFGDFVEDTLPDAIESGVDIIKSVWDTVAGFFRTPINWVINTVWNDGLREAYNAVADLINADTLSRVSGIGSVPAFAEGGYARRGWALVGEEGPELVNFSNPGRVYTADETRDALAGASPSSITTEEVHAIADGSRPGSYGVGGGNWLTRGARWVADKTGISDAIDWVRGKLADGFRAAVKPVVNRVSDFVPEWGGVGSLAGDFMDWAVDGIADWIDAEDAAQVAASGSYDGEFTANPGGFNRPNAGPITSMAGQRSYIGRFGNMHWGVDIGNAIGSVVRAAYDGVVKRTGGGGMDQIVVVNHGGFDTAYMHNSAITKSVGTQVTGGEQIARSGTAGSGPHLHFELHPGGYYNPTLAVNDLFRDKGGLIYPGMNMVRNDTGKAEYVFNQAQFENLNRLAEQGGNGGRNLTVNQYGMDYSHADRNAQAFVFAERRESRKAGSR